MGNKESNPSDSKQFLQHERLGPTRVFEVKQNDPQAGVIDVQKMQITRNIQSSSVYDTWVTQLRKINDAQGLQLFLIPQKYQFEKAGLCGSSGLAKLTFNKFEFVLSSEIKNRNNLNKYFDETQIWYVLYNLVRAGNKFQLLKQKIGDIHPNNILINEDGQTAIISTHSIPGEIQNFDKYLQDKKSQVFLAPQQMKLEDIQKAAYNQKVDKCLAQVFSLGMTLLSAGTLQHCNDVYQKQPFKINTQRLNVLLDQFSKRYSPYLTVTLKSMLDFNPQTRSRSNKIYQTLLPYENQILDLEPFQVNTYSGIPPSYSASSNGYYNQSYGVNPNSYTGHTVNQQPIQYQPSFNIPHGQSVTINNHPVPAQVRRF